MVVCFFELFDGVSFATDGHVWAENVFGFGSQVPGYLAKARRLRVYPLVCRTRIEQGTSLAACEGFAYSGK